jgi:hypothetical protein
MKTELQSRAAADKASTVAMLIKALTLILIGCVANNLVLELIVRRVPIAQPGAVPEVAGVGDGNRLSAAGKLFFKSRRLAFNSRPQFALCPLHCLQQEVKRVGRPRGRRPADVPAVLVRGAR